MRPVVWDAQRVFPVNTVRVTRLARKTIRALGIRTGGILEITFIGSRQIRTLNRRFLRHDRPTDVLSFRYHNHARGSKLEARGSRPQPGALNPEPIVGEIFIAPALARAYARQHGLSYEEELSRYVVHGILHWLGREDKTIAQQHRMRERENRLLTMCGVRQLPRTPNPEPRTSRNGHSHR